MVRDSSLLLISLVTEILLQVRIGIALLLWDRIDGTPLLCISVGIECLLGEERTETDHVLAALVLPDELTGTLQLKILQIQFDRTAVAA